jgi:ADP-ribosylation factor family
MLAYIRKLRLKERELRILLLYVCAKTEFLPKPRHELISRSRGLDGAGKSSICANLLKQDLNDISPTLGFEIKTVERDGYVASSLAVCCTDSSSRYKLNICMFSFDSKDGKDELIVMTKRGRRRSKNLEILLAQLL